MSNKPIMNAKQEGVVLMALVRLMMLARHSLSPTQTEIATKSAGELLWLLDIPSFTHDGKVFHAREPDGEIFDIKATRQITPGDV